jgi:hypothetical protein
MTELMTTQTAQEVLNQNLRQSEQKVINVVETKSKIEPAFNYDGIVTGLFGVIIIVAVIILITTGKRK